MLHPLRYLVAHVLVNLRFVFDLFGVSVLLQKVVSGLQLLVFCSELLILLADCFDVCLLFSLLELEPFVSPVLGSLIGACDDLRASNHSDLVTFVVLAATCEENQVV